MDDAIISKLLILSQLSLKKSEKDSLVDDLDQIIEFVDIMATVPTEGVVPLSHPLDIEQPLRSDRVLADTDRARTQASAPAIRNGLYVVPRVVDRS